MNTRALLQLSPHQWAAFNPPEPLRLDALDGTGVQLYLKREDRLHDTVSGNKLYKLHGHLQAARARGCDTLLSFGGYYSNHLHALAAAGKALGLNTIGVVRGHSPARLTATLQDCRDLGMLLLFVSRRDYRNKLDPQWLQQLLADRADVDMARLYTIAEGGQGEAGMAGCRAIVRALESSLELAGSTVCVPCGTGTTLAGMLRGSRRGERYLGFSALKLGSGLQQYKQDVAAMAGGAFSHGEESCGEGACGEGACGISVAADWDIIDEFHCGGFARSNAELIEFMRQFESATAVPLDQVYTGKMLLGMVTLAQRGFWPAGHRLIAIHTGGLQGRRGEAGLQHNAKASTTVAAHNTECGQDD